MTIDVPSLRERVDDIPLAWPHISLARSNAKVRLCAAWRCRAGSGPAYSWPGNVRQLENAIRRLVFTATEEEITRAEVEVVLGNQPAMEPRQGTRDGDKLSGSVAKHLRRYFDLHGGELPPPGLYNRILREVEGAADRDCT